MQLASAQWIYVGITLIVGVGAGVQASLLGSMGRDRGPLEAGWVSILGTVVGAAIFLAVRSARGDALLSSPFDRPWIFVAVALVTTALLLLSMRELGAYFAITGLFGLAVIVSAAFVGPRLGVAVFIALLITGQMFAALILDHVGAFGADVQRVTAMRVAGVGVMLLGVALMRRGGD